MIAIKKRITPPIAAFFLSIILFIVGGFINPGFANYGVAMNILRVAAFLGIMAAGQTLVILSGGGGIDLSLGSNVTLGAIIVFMIVNGRNGMVLPALGLNLLLGLAIGAINGIGVAVLNVPAIVMTLGMSGVVQGIILIISQGASTGGAAPIMNDIIAKPLIFNIPGVVFVWLALALVIWVVLERTRYGKELFAIGVNREAARLSGVNVKWVIIVTYMLGGMLATFGGFVLLGYTKDVFLSLGSSYTLPSVAAVVIGGTAIAGGRGSYSGTVAGALVITLITSLLTTLMLPQSVREIVYGGVLIILLVIYGRQSSLRS
jgi:ribose transport system permease protein